MWFARVTVASTISPRVAHTLVMELLMRRLWITFFCLLALALPSAAQAATNLPADVVHDEIILKLSSAAPPAGGAIGALLRQVGAHDIASLGANSATYRIHVMAGAHVQALIAQLNRTHGVAYAELNATRTMMREINDPVATQQWALNNLHAREAWDITTGGPIIIALLDTGVSANHPDLKGRVLQGFDATTGGSDSSDWEGHGTYTAGVAAAAGNNGVGVAGMCWGCNVLPVRVLNSDGRGDDATIATGMRWAVDHGARIISMSLGGPEDTQVLRDAVQYARERNVLLVASSGNGQADGNEANYPAAYEGVIAVSATAGNDSVTGFSTTGDYVDIAAPGVGVWSTLWTKSEGNTYGPANGTSASCPHVAGAAALVWTLRPEASADQVGEILEASADDGGAPGKDPQLGYGRLNLLRAVQLAADPQALSHARIRGIVPGTNGAAVRVSLSSGQQTQTDQADHFSFDNLPAGSYTVSVDLPNVAPQQTYVSGTALSVATINFNGAPSDAARFFAPVAPTNENGVAFFPQTNHTLRGEFRAFWLGNGGLPIFGYPTSEEFSERGEDGKDYSVQYFERHRLEFHPDNPAAYRVQLSRLGDTILQLGGRSWYGFARGGEQPNCRFFAETGHSLCGAFLNYWRANGLELDGKSGKTEAESLALFGQPLSELQVETTPDGQTITVQWFERTRFEDHGPQGVLLGLLANELTKQRGWR